MNFYESVRKNLNESEEIKEVSPDIISKYISYWDGSDTSDAVIAEIYKKYDYLLANENGRWVAIDNSSGDCWTEEFPNKEDAIAWLNDEFEMDDYLEKRNMNESAKGKKRRKRPRKAKSVIKPRKKRKRRTRKLKESVYDLPGVKCILCYYDAEKHNRPGSDWMLYSHYTPANTLKFVLNGEMMRPEKAKYYNILSLGEYEDAYKENAVLGVDKYADRAKELPPRPVKEAENKDGSYHYEIPFYYGPGDISNVHIVVTNGSSSGYSYDELLKFFDNASINNNDLTGEDWMFDIPLPDHRNLAYKGKNGNDRYSYYTFTVEKDFKEAEEEFKPNGVVDDIKKRGDGDLDITSPMELNTGVLPILDTNTYGKDDIIYSDEYNEDGEYGYYEYYENGEGKNFVKTEEPTMEAVDEAMMREGQPILEERIKRALHSAKVEVTGVYHPRQYNFSGDELEFNLSFDTKELIDLMNKAVEDPAFKEYLKNYRSYDGFISYMADDLDEFYQQDGWKKAVQVIMYYLKDEDDCNLDWESSEDFWYKVQEDLF